MNFQDLLHISDLLGTFAFAVSGALVGIRKKMDLFGVLVLSVATATGGGMLRSLLIGNTPPFFLTDINYLLVSILGGLLVFYFRGTVKKYYSGVLIFDAFGLAIFLNIGISVALSSGLSYWASVLLGMITAAFGGLIRDVMASEVPVVLRRELYATLALLGGVIYIILYHFNFSEGYIVTVVAAFVFISRLLSIKYDLHLPN